MKKITHLAPFFFRIALAILSGFAAIAVSGIVYQAVPIKTVFPLVAEVLLLLATFMLYRTEKVGLLSLGLKPSVRNIGYLFFGLAIGVLALLMATWFRTLYTGEVWHLSSAIDGAALLKSLYFVLPTVVVQELMFRGYLFTKTISRFGVVKTNIIFAILFTAVHIVDRDVWQSTPRLISLLVCIPIGHLWFASALLRSKTILFPIGLHWGNNWAVMHLSGTSDNGQSVFYLTGQTVFTTWTPFVILLLIFNVFFLLVTWATWKGRWPALLNRIGKQRSLS